jgi:uncharacterized protein
MKVLGLSVLAVLVAGAAIFLYTAQRPALKPADEALLNAAKMNDRAAFDQALANGADPNAKVTSRKWDSWTGEKNWEEGYTALMYAAQHGNLEGMGKLLDRGAQINAQSAEGITALMAAANAVQAKAVQFLLDKGADIRLKAHTGSTVLDCATKRNTTRESRDLEILVARKMNEAGVQVKVPPPFNPEGGM